jgi:hypothetical protein
MGISIPSNWNVWETNPRKYDGVGDTCFDYLVDSPDYKHEIKIYVTCGAWDAMPSPCQQDTVYLEKIQDVTIVRFPDQDIPNKYYYATAYVNAECTVPNPPSIWLKFHGELHAFLIMYSYNGNDGNIDLPLADTIVLSFLHNP